MRRSKRALAALLFSPALLAGCSGESLIDIVSGGGSGGGSGGSTLPFTTHPALLASFLDNLDGVRAAANALITSDPRYTLQDSPGGYYSDMNGNGRYDPGIDVDLEGSPIKHAGIHYAHAAGLTGAGQTIAVSDAGFLAGHEAFAGKTVTTGTGMAVDDHGTRVASIAAGNSSTMIGVAPNADLILGGWNTTQLTETANTAASAGAVAYNNSWGYSGSQATAADYNSVFSGTTGTAYLNALKNYAQDGIVLFAIDNDHTRTEIGLMPGLPILEPDLEESWIAVVNGVPVMENDDIISAQRISGACLGAAAWCMAADGTWTAASSTSTSSYDFGTGTSFASPTIAGSLALLAEAFPTLTPQELRIRLFASADNEFTGFTADGSVELVPGFSHSYSNEWGHGFLDVAAALLPIGQSTITTSSGVVIDPEQPMVVTGGASGDAVSRALKGVDIVSQDALAAQFNVNGAALVVDAPVAPLFSNSDVTNFDRVQDASFETSAFFGSGVEVPAVWGDEDVSFSFYKRSELGADSYGFGASRRFDLDGASLKISTAFGGDTGALTSDWANSTDGAVVSAGMALTADISPAAAVTFEVGYASGRESSGLGQSANVLMNAAALSLAQKSAFVRNDRLKLSLSLPAAVTSGSTSVNLPVALESGGMEHRSIPIHFSPEKREVRLEIAYERPVARDTSLGLSLAHAQNHGNIAGNSETGVMFSVTKRF